jgi:hypothetical protein
MVAIESLSARFERSQETQDWVRRIQGAEFTHYWQVRKMLPQGFGQLLDLRAR